MLQRSPLTLFRGDVAAVRSANGSVGRWVVPNLLAVGLYRLSQAARLHLPAGNYFGRLICWIGQVLTGAEIDPKAEIGPGLYLSHTGGIVVGEHVRAGSRLKLYGGVVLGSRPDRGDNAYPMIGDDVTIYTKATILGAVTLGDASTVGAHALVLHDVEAGATVAGTPARRVGSTTAD